MLPPLPRDVEPYPVVANIAFAEGPAFDSRGNLYFVNYARIGTLGRMSPDATVAVWTESVEWANGLKCDACDRVVCADYGGRRVVRFDPDTRAMTVLTDRFEDAPYFGPNDVCLDPAGNVYFSDPEDPYEEKGANPSGSVYRINLAGGDRPRGVERVAAELRYPNGLAVHPDGGRLYVAVSGESAIIAFDIRADGSLGTRQTVVAFPTETVDGVAFDEHGRLWVARWRHGTVAVVDVERGELCGEIPAGGLVTNLCWWQDALYVTVPERRSIHRLEVGVRGARFLPAGAAPGPDHS